MCPPCCFHICGDKAKERTLVSKRVCDKEKS